MGRSAGGSVVDVVLTRKSALLAGVGAAALLLAAALASPASAATYYASTDSELRAYITIANSDGDPNSTIVLTASFPTANVSLPIATKPVTIDTQGFTLSGVAGTGASPGSSILITNVGGVRTLLGTFIGGSADLASGGNGVQIRLGGSVINGGLIVGGASLGAGGGNGVDIGGTGSNNTLVNNGIIRGGAGATVGGAGLYVRGGTSPIINTGTIEGGNGNSAVLGNSGTTSITLTNSGTIRAGTGQATAIRLTDGASNSLTLELQAGSVIEGNVLGNATAANDVLRLGGAANSTFDASTIGDAAQYRFFNTFQKTGTSTWTLTGTTTALTPWQLMGGTLAVSSDGALGDVAGALTFNGGSLRALASFESMRAMTFTTDGIFEVDPAAVLTMSGALAGAGGLRKLGDGTLIQNSVVGYVGGTSVEDGTLEAGAANVFGGSYSTLAGATLDLAGFNQTIASLSNAGAARLGGAPGTTLTVTGNYVGSGGVVYLNTALGDDSSTTDLLDVDGNTSGTSSLVVTNVGGAGAQTVEGIKVINVDGTSGGSFALVGDYVFEGDQAVVGGAYAYRLYQGSTTDPTNGDWYLRSELIDAGPLYAPTVPLYENYANVLQAFNGLGTLQQRVGSRQWLADGAPVSPDEGAVAPDGIWARIDASQAHFEPEVSTTGASYDVTTWKLQAGMDGAVIDSEAGALVAGVNAQFGTVSSDIASIYGVGSINAFGYGLGATLTWYGESGLYVDGQAQLAWYDADIASDSTGTTLVEGNDAFGYGLSLEAGHKVGLDDTWSLTPQAQVSYSSVRFDEFTDQYGGVVSLAEGGDTLVGRLGLSADYESAWQDAKGEMSHAKLYGIANLYYDFLDGSSVDVSGTGFMSRNQALSGSVGLGGSIDRANASLYGEASVRTSLGEIGDSYSLGASGGLKVKW